MGDSGALPRTRATTPHPGAHRASGWTPRAPVTRSTAPSGPVCWRATPHWRRPSTRGGAALTTTGLGAVDPIPHRRTVEEIRSAAG
ncbi:hypothetical protein LV779_24830 [Streptomyces thinghirensis]|nr:hypothetical protein [Streptomyces thinghirensis]